MNYKTRKIHKNRTKNRSKNRTKNRTKNKTKNRKGGEVIAAGGFGCVFSPALRCINSNKRQGDISKLLEKKDAENEWNELKNVKKTNNVGPIFLDLIPLI